MISSVACHGTIAAIALLTACGPTVGGDSSGAEEGSASGETGSSSTGEVTTGESADTSSGDASSSDTGVPECTRDAELQWAMDVETETPLAVAVTPTGDLVVVGRTGIGDDANAYIGLRDAEGAEIWTLFHGGSLTFADEAIDVAVGDDGSIDVLTREYLGPVPDEKGGEYDAHLVVLRLTAEGDVEWIWEREDPPAMPGANDIPEGIIEAVGESVVVLESHGGHPNARLELDANGSLAFDVDLPLGGEEYPQPYGRSISRDGDVVLLDYAGEPDVDPQLRVRRFDAFGTQRWSDVFGTMTDKPRFAIAGPSETYVGFGEEAQIGYTIMLRRYDGDGSEAWTIALHDTTASPEIAGTIAPNGDVLVTSRRMLVASPPEGAQGNEPLWVGRIAPDGCPLWRFETAFPGASNYGWGHAIAGTVDGAAAVLGLYQDGGPEKTWVASVADAP